MNMGISLNTLWTAVVAQCKLTADSSPAIHAGQHESLTARQVAWASGLQCLNESCNFSLGFSYRRVT